MFQTLNEQIFQTPAVEDGRIPLEIEIDKDIQLHVNALDLISRGRLLDASDIYTSLLTKPHVLEKLSIIPDVHASSQHLLQYVVNKNYGRILQIQNNIQGAMEFYLKALAIDEQDAVLWITVADLAKELNKPDAELHSYLKAYKYSINSKIFTCRALEGICAILAESRDFQTCYQYILKGLYAYPEWEFGRNLKSQIIRNEMQFMNVQTESALHTYINADDIVQYYTSTGAKNIDVDDMLITRPLLQIDRSLLDLKNAGTIDIEIVNCSLSTFGNRLLTLYQFCLDNEDKEFIASANVRIILPDIKSSELFSTKETITIDISECEILALDPISEKRPSDDQEPEDSSNTNNKTKADQRSSKRVKSSVENANVSPTALEHIDENLPSNLSFSDDAFKHNLNIRDFIADFKSKLIGKPPSMSIHVEKKRSSKAFVLTNINSIDENELAQKAIRQMLSALSVKSVTLFDIIRETVIFLLKEDQEYLYDSSEEAIQIVEFIRVLLEKLEVHQAAFLANFNPESIKIALRLCFLLFGVCIDSMQHDLNEREAGISIKINGVKNQRDSSNKNPYYMSSASHFLLKHWSRLSTYDRARWDDDAVLIYSWLTAIVYEKRGYLKEALCAYNDILAFLSDNSMQTIITPFSKQDITKVQISEKIAKLEAQRTLQQSELVYKEGGYQQIISSLAILFMESNNHLIESVLSNCSPMKRFELLGYLKGSYERMDEKMNVWICLVMSFSIYTRMAADIGLKYSVWITNIVTIMAELEGYLKDRKKFRLSVLENYSCTIDFKNNDNIKNLLQEFIFSVMVLMRLSWEVIPCITDSIKPFKKIKSEACTKLIFYSIKLFNLVIEHLYTTTKQSLAVSDTSSSSNTFAATDLSPISNKAGFYKINRHSEVLSYIHEHLGKFRLCCMDDGEFVREIITYLKENCADVYAGEMYQCYSCLYGIKIKIDGDYLIEDHHTITNNFNFAEAEQVFLSVYQNLVRRLATKGFRGIGGDSKECLEKLKLVLGNPSFENGKLAMNRAVIDSYLGKSLEEVSMNLESTPTLSLNDAQFLQSTGVSNIHSKMHYIYGKNAMIQFRSTPASQRAVKSSEVLYIAIENYLMNLYLDSKSIITWIELGYCYGALAYEFLGWSANEIKTNHKTILKYLSKAFLCYMQGCALIKRYPNQIPLDAKETACELYADFGYICYTLSSNPIKSFTIFTSKAKQTWMQRSAQAEIMSGFASINDTLLTQQLEEPTLNSKSKHDLLSLSLRLFTLAEKNDRTEWQYPYMRAVISIKFFRKPEVIGDLFRIALSRLPEDAGTKEQEKIWDCHYAFLSWVTKNYFSNQQADIVTRVFKDAQLRWLNGVEPLLTTLSPPERLLECFERIKAIDKKRWQHRVVYRTAWLKFHILQNSETAKEEMSTLFNLKPTSKTLTSFWRTEFERPGKYFAYVMKYTNFFITLLTLTKDTETFRSLVKRVRKSEDVFMDYEQVWASLVKSYSVLLCEESAGAIGIKALGSLNKSEFEAKAQALIDLILSKHEEGIVDIMSQRVLLIQKMNELLKLSEKKYCLDEMQEKMVDLYVDLVLECQVDKKDEPVLKAENHESQSLGTPQAIASKASIQDESIKVPYLLKKIMQLCKPPTKKAKAVAVGTPVIDTELQGIREISTLGTETAVITTFDMEVTKMQQGEDQDVILA